MTETPAEAGRRIGIEHAKNHPLTDAQRDAAARTIAGVIRERMERQSS